MYRAFTTARKRIFNLTIESQVFDHIDIFTLAGGSAEAVTLGATVIVDDGFASIEVAKDLNDPKINGIEIKLSVPHIAHSVSNGPYFFVDTSNVGFATVTVDGSESHTHGTDLFLTTWTWKKGAQVLGTAPVCSFVLPVGTHDITLTVVDSGNHQATEATTVTVYPFGFPSIDAVTPSSGSIFGGEQVTISGTGFNFSAAETIVNFGEKQLTGSAIQVVDAQTITTMSPQIPIGVPVLISVETPVGRSKDATYTYVSSTPISFSTTKLLDFTQPTSVAFGPDGKLYVGSVKGTLAKITLNANYTSLVSVASAVVQPDRAILGIAFDPLDAGNPIPYVYISSSLLFHGESKSSSGKAINGKISRISGANLDSIEDIVSGLPVCDHDHGKTAASYCSFALSFSLQFFVNCF
jgi:IPT/TIG domain